MRSADAYAELLRLGRPIVEAREAANRLGLSLKRTTLLLRSLEQAGLVLRLRPGLWALRPDTDLFSVPPYLTAPLPAYVSVWSALARHGMIEQIPRTVSVASTDRTRRVETTLAVYEVHHLVPELFGGFTGSQESGYVATPEKALFDTIYLRAPAGGGVHLPELELPPGFDEGELAEWLGKVSRPRLRTLVARGLDAALVHATSHPPSQASPVDRAVDLVGERPI
jgi:predicted transcriptional regulator of viral defense system